MGDLLIRVGIDDMVRSNTQPKNKLYFILRRTEKKILRIASPARLA